MAEIKPIILTDTETNEKYTLEFSRESVKFAEDRGFAIADLDRYPMTKVPELFYYAFRMHHKNISRQQTDKMLFEQIGGVPDGMLERLAQLYSAPFDVFEKRESKNSTMTVDM